MIGWNARMDGIQGAVLNVKLKHLPEWNEARRKNAKIYSELLSEFDRVTEPMEADYARHVYHVYAVRLKNRDSFIQKLAEKEIFYGIHYPVPVHLQEAYNSLDAKHSNCRIADTCAKEYVSLPMYPELTRHQIEYVVDSIKDFVFPG
jgi:dTDP-4-amino-4,6-dideoxygalactose transaminase